MANTDIQLWMKNPDFDTGLELFRSLAPKSALIFFFEKKIYGLKRLMSELQKLADKEPAAAEQRKPAMKRALPPEVKALRETALDAWKEARNLHSTIDMQRSKTKRRLMAARILELVPQVFDAWHKIDHWDETGDLSLVAPAKPQLSRDNLDMLIHKLKNIPTYITKLEAKLKKEKDLKRINEISDLLARHKTDFAAVKARLEFLNQKISELGL